MVPFYFLMVEREKHLDVDRIEPMLISTAINRFIPYKTAPEVKIY